MSEIAGPVSIEAMREQDIEAVIGLASVVWHDHYPGIISIAQIDYMLAERYNSLVLREELARNDLWWDVLRVADALSAFSSYFLTGTPGEMKLDKLYVTQHCQRRGLGGQLIERARSVARSRSCTRLILAVNRHNASAIAAYRRYGFDVEHAVVKDIGGGFVMDDFIMVRRP